MLSSQNVFAMADCLRSVLSDQKAEKIRPISEIDNAVDRTDSKITQMLENAIGKIETKEREVIINGNRYQEKSGGPLKLEHNNILAGSEVSGGKQPNYIIDLKHPAMRPILEYAKEIGKRDLPIWDKVDLIQQKVLISLKSKNPYINPDYQALLKRYFEEGIPISLGEYLKHHVGVCREHAALLHLALTEANIESRYLYVRTAVQSERGRDHAIVIFENNGELYIADAYFKEFHKQKLRDVWIGAPESDKFFPFDQVLPYPKIWKPEIKEPLPSIFNKDFTLLNKNNISVSEDYLFYKL